MSTTVVQKIEHGTRQACEAHKRDGEKPCAACKKFNVQRSAALRIRNGGQKALQIPALELGELLVSVDEDVCHQFGEVFGHDIVAACMDLAAATAWAGRRSA